VDTAPGTRKDARTWPVLGNFPKQRFTASEITKNEDALKVVNEANGIKTTVEVRLPDPNSSVELWTVTVKNLTDTARQLKVVPYLEWVLGKNLDDRFHTQYARLNKSWVINILPAAADSIKGLEPLSLAFSKLPFRISA